MSHVRGHPRLVYIKFPSNGLIAPPRAKKKLKSPLVWSFRMSILACCSKHGIIFGSILLCSSISGMIGSKLNAEVSPAKKRATEVIIRFLENPRISEGP